MAVVSTLALMIALIGAGFIACVAPPVTLALSNSFSDDATSPFSRSQLVQVADATRGYSFGAHDLGALYRAIYEVDLELRQDIVMANGSLPHGFPALDEVKSPDSASQIAAAFSGASEIYCYSPETVSHLDDCYGIAHVAYAALAIVGMVLLACLIAGGVLGGKRLVGGVFFAAGIAALGLLAVLGVFAVIDFNRFFTLFHGVFFAQGNWTFPYDSLLICALPTAFWVGMGVIWLAVTALLSILSIAIGSRLKRR